MTLTRFFKVSAINKTANVYLLSALYVYKYSLYVFYLPINESRNICQLYVRITRISQNKAMKTKRRMRRNIERERERERESERVRERDRERGVSM